ncbi:MAG: AAA family ATPase [Pseudohongiellaceae bacterium]
MTQIIITTGPECCGKTSLAKALSKSLRAPLVTEIAREYLNIKRSLQPNFQYQQKDLLQIAQLQHQAEQEATNSKTESLICDTDLLVILIWSEVKYGNCHPWISTTLATAQRKTRRTYLLCDTSIDWQPDALRENPNDRLTLFTRYQEKLTTLGARVLIVKGDEHTRLTQAKAFIAS